MPETARPSRKREKRGGSIGGGIAAAFRARAADSGALARQIVNWRHAMVELWPTLRFGEVKAETKDNQHWFEAQVYLGEMALDAVRVELYADAVKGEHAMRVKMDRARPIVGAVNGYLYIACVPAPRSASDYTARIVPHHDGVAVPLEAVRILWQR